MILCSNPKAEYLSHADAINSAVHGVFHRGLYINGPEVAAFEKEFAHFVGVPHAIGVANGTDALELALRAYDIGPGDEVITVSHTANATVAAIERTGASPVLVDIDPDTYTLIPESLYRVKSERTKAVIAVHLYGHPADLDPIIQFCKQFSIKLIEDCAQAHGAKYKGKNVGSIGDISCFSFYPTKNLGAIGDGGAVTTTSFHLSEKLYELREYGWKEKYCSRIKGVNSRLDEIQAAILRVKLPFLSKMNARRKTIAQKYTIQLQKLPLCLPSIEPNVEHVFHLFVIKTDMRDELKAFLLEHGIHTLIHYPIPIHLQPAYLEKIRTDGDLPNTLQAAKTILSLPMHSELKDDEISFICNKVSEFFKNYT